MGSSAHARFAALHRIIGHFRDDGLDEVE